MGNCASDASQINKLDGKYLSKSEIIVPVLKSLNNQIISSNRDKHTSPGACIKKALTEVLDIVAKSDTVDPDAMQELHNSMKLVKKYQIDSFNANLPLFDRVKSEMEGKVRDGKFSYVQISFVASDSAGGEGPGAQNNSTRTGTTSDCDTSSSSSNNNRSYETIAAPATNDPADLDVTRRSSSKTKVAAGQYSGAHSCSNKNGRTETVNRYDNRVGSSDSYLVDKRNGSWRSDSTDSDDDPPPQSSGKHCSPPAYNDKYVGNSNSSSNNSKNSCPNNSVRDCSRSVLVTQKACVYTKDKSPIRFFAAHPDNCNADHDDDYGFVDVFQ